MGGLFLSSVVNVGEVGGVETLEMQAQAPGIVLS